MEPFIWVLLFLGWVVFQIIQRVMRPPRPLGTIRDEPEEEKPREEPESYASRGRPEPLPVPQTAHRRPVATAPAVPGVPQAFAWGRDAAQQEIAAARAMGRRQQARREEQAGLRRQRHRHRPQLHSKQGLRDAVVAAAVLGPCRALEAYKPPG